MREAVADLSMLVERGRATWEEDKFVRLAAKKRLEILGEAAKQVSDEVRSQYPDVPWRDLARVRDVYTHAYHRVDYDLMWEQLVTQLPDLRQTLGRIEPDDVDEG